MLCALDLQNSVAYRGHPICRCVDSLGLKAQIAQSVEQRTENPRVGGSIPSLGTNNNAACTSGR